MLALILEVRFTYYLHMEGSDTNSFSPYILLWHPHSLTSLILPYTLTVSHSPTSLWSHFSHCHTPTPMHMGLDACLKLHVMEQTTELRSSK